MRYALLCILILVCACGQPSTRASEVSNTQIQTNVSDTKLALVDLSGNEWKPPKDKILILNLWATWCKPCIEEMPAFKEMADQLPEQFEIFLASDEELERINAFVTRKQLDLPFGQLVSNIENLGVYSLPTTIVFDPEGEILETIVGAQDWNSSERINSFLTHIK